MKYAIALFTVMIPTILVGLSVFHLLIMPFVAPFGLMSFTLTTAVFGLLMGTIAEHAVLFLHDYLETRFP